MEPRSFKRGNEEGMNVTTIVVSRLQWSHVHSNVETLYPSQAKPSPERFNGATFIQTWKRFRIRWRKVAFNCFNGATFIQTWKLARVPDEPTQSQSLQWSHVHSNVETTANGVAPPSRKELQWSHVHSNVETSAITVLLNLLIRASMEPRSFKRGNVYMI